MIQLRQQEQLAQQQRQNAEAQNRCCKCVRREESFCTRLTSVVSCDAFRGGPQYAQLSSAQSQLLENFTCTEIPSASCDAFAGPMVAIPAPSAAAPTAPARPPTGGAAAPAPICSRTFPSLGEAVATIHGATSTSEATAPTTPEFESITPTLGVDIPGLSFSPARQEDGLIYVPFLAQYIAAVQRYAVGLAVVAAIIMVVYGGFLYLLGASIQDVSTGKQIIADALIGMIIALSGYFILHTVNPNVITLPEIKLGYIRPEFWGENQGAYATTQAGTSPCRCAPIPSEVNEARVLPVPCYYQAAGAWGSTAYGPNLIPGEPVPSNLTTAVGVSACTRGQFNSGPNKCVGTFQQGGCGPTSLAVVLGYYNAMSREGSPVTPIEAARYLIRAGLRPFNEGTHGICSSVFTENFPGFTCENISGLPSSAGLQRIITEIRAGHPVIFHCNKCRVRKADGRIMAGTGEGHFMVFTGVSEDGNILSVHDVGWGPPDGAVAMTAADIASAQTFSAPGLRDGVMKTYVDGAVTAAYLVKPLDPARIPAGNTCQGRARRNSSTTSGSIIRIPFTYCPGNVCDGNLYKQNEASIIMDSKWLKAQNPAFRVFMYIHGLNHGGTGESGSSKWKRILSDYPGEASTPILIIRPHNFGSTTPTLFRNMNTQEVLTQALQALQNYRLYQGTSNTQTIGRFSIRDIAITAHSSGICGGHFARASQQRYSYNGQSIPIRGLVAFDGYGKCSLDEPSFVNPTGIAYIMNPDIGSEGMGVIPHTTTPFAPTMAERHGMSLVTCPAYAGGGGVTRCWTKAQSTSNNGYAAENNGWVIFETNLGHDPSVDRVAGYAMRAFYGSGN
jgi:hypothetical protein